MNFETIVDPLEARNHVGDESWVFVDCRFFLNESDRGHVDYERSHIPGAIYAHLNQDLSGPVVPGRTGRHPLPSQATFARTVGEFGIGRTTQVVAYDESTGAMAAARLWWLLKWVGHDAVAVLDGGFNRWAALGFPRAHGVERRSASFFQSFPRPHLTVEAADVLAVLGDPEHVVLDARAEERYRGQNETIDPVAGHIRGALSAPYFDNLDPDGSFKSPHALRERFLRLTGRRDAAHIVFYCGSGVTAAHNVLAFAYAANGMPRLYAGSWSEWITDPSRPIATGSQLERKQDSLE